MKNIVKSVFVLFAALAVSCNVDDVQDRPIIEGVDSPVLSAPESASTYTLLPENMAQQAERFVWSKANYNGDVAISYALQIDVEGGSFATPQSLGGTTGALQLSVSVETLNTACLALGATPYTAANFDVRVVSSASGFDMMASNKVTISITPYTTETPKLFVIGNFLNASGYGSDWTPAATLPALASSGFGQTDFEGYVYMNMASPEFKLLPTNTGFDGDYGDDGTFSGVLLQTNESNIQLSGASYYKINANTSTLVYTTTATQWACTGSATTLSWPAGPEGTDGQDMNLTYNTSTKKWEAVLALTAGGEIKFRANNRWTLNYGDNGADGSLEEGGANIAVATTGNYLVALDLSNPRAYTYTLTPQ